MSKTARKSPPCFSAIAPALLRNGFHPIPLKGKLPRIRNWQRKASATAVNRWCRQFPTADIGILTGHVVAADLDINIGPLANAAQACVEAFLGPTDFIRYGCHPRRALLYRIDGSPIAKLSTAYHPSGRAEILGLGQQIAAYGIHPVTGQQYQWPKQDIASANIASLPVVTEHQLRQMVHALDALLSSASPPVLTPSTLRIMVQGHHAPAAPTPANQNAPGSTISTARGVLVGNRNNGLFAQACAEAWSCSSVAQLEAKLRVHNQSLIVPLPFSEVHSIAASVWRYKSLGRLFKKEHQIVVLPIGKDVVKTLAKDPVALRLYALLRATRPESKAFGIAQVATAREMKCGKRGIQRGIRLIIQEGLMVEIERLPPKWPHQGARQYRFKSADKR